MSRGDILGFAIAIVAAVGIAASLIVWARALARLQARILEVQLASVRVRGPLYARIIGGIFILAGGAFALAGMSLPPVLLPALVIPGLLIALLGMVMVVAAAPAARFQQRVLEWEIGWMSGDSGARIIRGIGILVLVAFLGGLFFGHALGPPA
jgi:hypothetical protein